MGSTLCSQTAVLNNKKDSLIAFTIKQSRFLQSEAFRANELGLLWSVCETQRLDLKEIIMNDKKEHINDSIINNNNMQALRLKQIEVDEQKSKLTIAETEIKKQKVQKWVAIGVSALIVIGETFLFLKPD